MPDDDSNKFSPLIPLFSSIKSSWSLFTLFKSLPCLNLLKELIFYRGVSLALGFILLLFWLLFSNKPSSIIENTLNKLEFVLVWV
jgi:hypothetical protein